MTEIRHEDNINHTAAEKKKKRILYLPHARTEGTRGRPGFWNRTRHEKGLRRCLTASDKSVAGAFRDSEWKKNIHLLKKKKSVRQTESKKDKKRK